MLEIVSERPLEEIAESHRRIAQWTWAPPAR
jgi:hypothetical protein